MLNCGYGVLKLAVTGTCTGVKTEAGTNGLQENFLQCTLTGTRAWTWKGKNGLHSHFQVLKLFEVICCFNSFRSLWPSSSQWEGFCIVFPVSKVGPTYSQSDYTIILCRILTTTKCSSVICKTKGNFMLNKGK